MNAKHTIEITADDLKDFLKEKLKITARNADIKITCDRNDWGDRDLNTLTLAWEDKPDRGDYWDR